MHDGFLLLFDGLGEEVIDPQPSSGQPRNFGAPFDRGDSNVTIRSCDCVDFQVHQATLGIASVAFKDMFTAPGPSPHVRGQVKQVINLAENSKTLLHLLSIIYPMDPIIPDTLEDALSLLSACQKYQTDSTATCIRALIRSRTPPLFTAENSFRAYGIASRYHLEEEALQAARLTLECSMDFNAIGEDLRLISGTDLFRLHGYRSECIKVAKDCIEKMMNHKAPLPISSGCYHSWYNNENRPKWWHGHFVLRIADRPSPKTTTDRRAFQDADRLHRVHCGSCSIKPDTSDAICAKFEVKLSEAIEQVRRDSTLGGTSKLMCISGPSRYLNIVCYEDPSPLYFDVFCAIETCSTVVRSGVKHG
jgi:hypothetical protein